MLKTLTILYISIIYCNILVHAQDFNPAFDRITVEDGLSNGMIYKIFQDSNGYMWFGTVSGLNKFDGYNFTVFKHNKDDSTTICGDFISDIIELDDRKLLVATTSGISVYHPELNIFSTLEVTIDGNKQLFNKKSWALCKISPDNLLINTNEGLWLYNLKSKTAGLFLDEFIDPSIRIHHIRKDSENKLWIGTDNQGLMVYDLKQDKIKNYMTIPEGSCSISSNRVICTYKDSFGNIWVGTGSGLDLFNPEKESFTHFKYNPSDIYSPGEGYVNTIHEDSRKRLWVSFLNGLSLYNNSTNKFQTFKNVPSNPKSIAGSEVWCMFNDSQGSLWMGTSNEGICKLDYNKALFSYFAHSPGNPNSLNNKIVNAIHEDKYGNLYIGVDNGGLNYYNRKTGTFSHFINNPNDPNSISSDFVQALEIDPDGNVWMATWGGGLNCFNPVTKQFRTYKLPENITVNVSLRTIFEDFNHNLWIGSVREGLFRFDIKTREFEIYKNIKGDSTSISNNVIYAITCDNENNIWAATANGLNKFIPETNTFKRYLYSEVNRQGFFCICIDNDGLFWLGNNSKELIRFDPKTENATFFSEDDGLSASNILSIVKDHNGYLWLETYDGLCWFHPQKGVIKTFNSKDGYLIKPSPYKSSVLLSTGEIAIGGSNGFVIFYPDSMRLNEHIPPVVITDFKIFNKQVKIGTKDSPLSKHISHIDSIVLDHEQSVFSFCFAALDYTAPEKNQYAYFLEGFEKDWNYVGNKREATYTNLDPGSYIFRVKASNNDGIWNEEGTSIHITVLPPWWRTWWFRGVIAIVIATILVSIYLLRVNTLKKQKVILREKVKERTKELQTANQELESKNIEIESINKELEEKDKYKTDFFHNITHEFKTPLTLIKGSVEMILDGMIGRIDENVEKHLLVAKKNSDSLNDYINQILELAKIDSKQIKVNLCKFDLVKFLKSVYSAFTPLTQSKNIELNLELPYKEMSIYFDLAKLQIILNNLLSNAVKYSKENSSIHILLKGNSDDFEISVHDNGIGISKNELPNIFERFRQLDSGLTRSDKGVGIGLALVKEYVDLLKGSIRVDSEPGKGSVFNITFTKDLRKVNLKSLIKTEEELNHKDQIVEYDFQLIEKQENNSPDGKNKNATLLIVEDNEDMLNFLKQILSDKYNVLEACDGKEGFEVCKRELPDIVISDVMMPNIDGFGLCKAIVENETTSHIPVILLSANADEKFQHRGLQEGAISYITKPFDPRKLLLQIKNQLKYIVKRQIENWNTVTKNTGKINTIYTGDAFLRKAQAIVLDNMHKESFDVDVFAKTIGLSKTQLYRKMKGVTGKSSGDFIRSIRLLEAKAMIENSNTTNLTVAEIAYKVGFSDPSYFTKAFKKQFGVNPSKLN